MPRLMFDAQFSSEWRTRPFEKTNTKTQNLRKCACWNGSQRQLKTPKTRATVQTPTDCHITQLCCTAKWHRQNRVLKLSSLNDNDYWMNLFMQFFGLLAPAFLIWRFKSIAAAAGWFFCLTVSHCHLVHPRFPPDAAKTSLTQLPCIRKLFFFPLFLFLVFFHANYSTGRFQFGMKQRT